MDGEHSTATMAVLVVLCLFGTLLGLKAVLSPFPEAPVIVGSSGTCTPRTVAKGEKITPDEVLVSVFNSTDRGGLARDTLSQLSQLGFHTGTDGNVEADYVRYAQIWADTPHDPAARLVARQFGPHVAIRTGQDTSIGNGVIVIVGSNFDHLRDGPSFVRAGYDTQICSPAAT